MQNLLLLLFSRNQLNRRRQNELEDDRNQRRLQNRTRMAQQRQIQWQQPARGIIWRNLAFNYEENIHYNLDSSVEIGKMNAKICTHCQAKKWVREPPGLCCSGGKVFLQPLENPPAYLNEIFQSTTPEGKHFKKEIRTYNSAFQMTSFGVSKEISLPGFMPTFKIQGQVYHNIGSLLPIEGDDPKFMQIFFWKTEMTSLKDVLTYLVTLNVTFLMKYKMIFWITTIS